MGLTEGSQCDLSPDMDFRRGSCALHEVLQILRVSLPRAYVEWDSLRGFAEVKPSMWTPFGLTCLPQMSSAHMCERGLNKVKGVRKWTRMDIACALTCRHEVQCYASCSK